MRQESLIQAGTLAVTGQTQFAEIKPVVEESQPNYQGICAVLRSNGSEIDKREQRFSKQAMQKISLLS